MNSFLISILIFLCYNIISLVIARIAYLNTDTNIAESLVSGYGFGLCLCIVFFLCYAITDMMILQ